MSKLLSHPWRQLLFVGLSLADLVLTWWLLSRTSGQVYESNPVAHWCLAQHGWLGMLGFKTGLVLLVIGLAAIIARFRPRVAGRVLGFGCAALALVVFYSVSLCRTVPRDLARPELEAQQQIERKVDQRKAYRATLEVLSEELVAGTCTMRQAVDRLAKTAQARDPEWLNSLAVINPGRSPEECLAANLVCFTLSRYDSATAQRLLPRFQREVLLTYGQPVHPHRLWHMPGNQPPGANGTAGTAGAAGTTDEGTPTPESSPDQESEGDPAL
jgi:hypothetical protein